MIYFFADNHYGVHPGKVILDHLPEALQKEIVFCEDDWTLLESGSWVADCDLLILNMIGGTCDIAHPGEGAQRAVRSYCEGGGNLLLLHGSSAAFWQWDWWRTLAGLRWVRPDDPDGAAPSTHPHEPYNVVLSKVRHPLAESLKELTLPLDEIYTELEQTAPLTILMQTTIGNGSFPQLVESVTPWGGLAVSFLPGHIPEVTSNQHLIDNIVVLIHYLKRKKS